MVIVWEACFLRACQFALKRCNLEGRLRLGTSTQGALNGHFPNSLFIQLWKLENNAWPTYTVIIMHYPEEFA